MIIDTVMFLTWKTVFSEKTFKFSSLAKHGFMVLISEPVALKMVCLNIISLRTGIKEKDPFKEENVDDGGKHCFHVGVLRRILFKLFIVRTEVVHPCCSQC